MQDKEGRREREKKYIEKEKGWLELGLTLERKRERKKTSYVLWTSKYLGRMREKGEKSQSPV